jgi:hypothetical protein
MDTEIQVIAANEVIDRIKRAVQIVDGKPVTIYRRASCIVHDGYIHAEYVSAAPLEVSNAHVASWKEVLDKIVPEKWPTHFIDCCELLRKGFSDHLPDGVIQAVTILATQGYCVAARELLLDFFVEKYDSEQVRIDICSAWLYAKNEKATSNVVNSLKHVASDIDNVDPYLPTNTIFNTQTGNDSNLREVAQSLQVSIGAFVARESGANIFGLDELPDDEESNFDLSTTHKASMQTPADTILLERLAKLGPEAIDILQYFADNPGDKPVHAELVLGYSKHNIQKLLSGLLGHYVEKSESGGWTCHNWVSSILNGLDQAKW